MVTLEERVAQLEASAGSLHGMALRQQEMTTQILDFLGRIVDLMVRMDARLTSVENTLTEHGRIHEEHGRQLQTIIKHVADSGPMR